MRSHLSQVISLKSRYLGLYWTGLISIVTIVVDNKILSSKEMFCSSATTYTINRTTSFYLKT